MNLEVIIGNFPKLLEGVVLTVELVVLALILGMVFAVPTALMRVSHNWLLRGPAYAYIFFFRGTPLLVQIFLIYYGLGQFDAVRESILWPILREPFWCAIIAFALNTGAYTGEIFRGGIEAVPRGQIEAARAFGMSRSVCYRRIILPQAWRIAMPAYGNEVILMLKGSALASTITLLDLTGMARTIIARTYMPVEIFLAAGALYLLLTFLFTNGYKLLERRMNRHMAPLS